ncbi:MAG TPA: hypothetical protein VHX13_05385 [Acidobacteriaceae bacterium]|jgi:hypothetical protein|nr:hypothetical protein [Acidobacteriaceae bacterium]
MFNPADLSPAPAPDHRCRFVKVNGARCRFPAKPDSDLCGDHHYKKLYTRGRLRPSPPSTFNTVPLVRFAWAEDHDSILFNCNQIALALVHSTITAREAGALNAVMHTAQRSLREKFLHERFEARERERSGAPTPAPADDIVTDYVLDTDGMPLALPDDPKESAEKTDPSESDPVESEPGAPSSSSRAVREDSVGSTPETNPEEPDAETIARMRDSILYLRDYYKNDPKMLAEIETYPGARYAPVHKHEPEHDPVILPTLTASTAEWQPCA